MTGSQTHVRNRAALFALSRAFKAPRSLVWQAWSEAERLQHWWGPKGCKIDVETMEFRPGGFFHYKMQFSNGPGWWGRFLYREIVPNERLVYINGFSNPGCGITRAPFSELCPLEMLSTVTMSDAAEGTLTTIEVAPLGATEAETQFFRDLFPSLETGYGGTCDQLDAYLGKVV